MLEIYVCITSAQYSITPDFQQYVSGLEIATNTVPNATNIFSLPTKNSFDYTTWRLKNFHLTTKFFQLVATTNGFFNFEPCVGEGASTCN